MRVFWFLVLTTRLFEGENLSKRRKVYRGEFLNVHHVIFAH